MTCLISTRNGETRAGFNCQEEFITLDLIKVVNALRSGSVSHLILVAKSKTPSQAACSMTRLKAEVRVCSGASIKRSCSAEREARGTSRGHTHPPGQL